MPIVCLIAHLCLLLRFLTIIVCLNIGCPLWLSKYTHQKHSPSPFYFLLISSQRNVLPPNIWTPKKINSKKNLTPIFFISHISLPLTFWRKNIKPKLYSRLPFKKIEDGHISSSWVEKLLHTENQVPRLPTTKLRFSSI